MVVVDKSMIKLILICTDKRLLSSSVFRCALLCQSNGQVRYEAACLMVLLLFDEVAMALPDKVNNIPFSLPKSLVRR